MLKGNESRPKINKKMKKMREKMRKRDWGRGEEGKRAKQRISGKRGVKGVKIV